MSFTAGTNFSLVFEASDINDLDEYEIASRTFTNNYTYILFLGSSLADSSTPEIPSTPPVTAGMTWTLINSAIKDSTPDSLQDGAIAAYIAQPTSGDVTAVTTVTYASVQERLKSQLFETSLDVEVVQSKPGTGTSSTLSITLGSEPGANNLVLSGFYAGIAAPWVPAGASNAMTTGTDHNFLQYKIGGDATVGASVGVAWKTTGVAVELTESAGGGVDTRLYTLLITDDGLDSGNPVIHSTVNGFDAGMTAELWTDGTDTSAIPATSIVALDTAPTATPQYMITFSEAPVNGVAKLYVEFSVAGGSDMISVTGGIALGDANLTSTTAMVCA